MARPVSRRIRNRKTEIQDTLSQATFAGEEKGIVTLGTGGEQTRTRPDTAMVGGAIAQNFARKFGPGSCSEEGKEKDGEAKPFFSFAVAPLNRKGERQIQSRAGKGLFARAPAKSLKCTEGNGRFGGVK